jgi:hypothetical protein
MGSFLAESALYCLDYCKHKSGVTLSLVDRIDEIVSVIWTFDLDERADSTYADLQEVTEYGAACIAILLTLSFTRNTTVQRSCKGGGFDYWVGNIDTTSEPPFQGCARLEVSGTLLGGLSEVRSRTKEKIVQTMKSAGTGIPAIVSVVEFATPIGTFVVA